MGGRNLVVLMDGTSNEVETDLTNVLKLYRMAVSDENQRVFYDPGVGTLGLQRSWGRARQEFGLYLGLATGWGIDRNILDAYAFLCRNWREGDRIFLYGFSRGAYTARAIAGLLYMIGLLDPDQSNLADYALTAYKRASSENNLKIAWQFRRVVKSRPAPVHFLGVWDTVASVLVPRWDHWLPAMEFLPYTKTNPGVAIFRHAAAIDERRRMFRLYGWAPDQEFRPDPFSAEVALQDQRTVWFAGEHSDIGGGHPEAESQASKHALLWMARESGAHGLRLDSAMIDHLARGEPLPGGRNFYVKPDVTSPVHDSLKGAWRLLEWIPKGSKWRRFPARGNPGGLYLPRGELRRIEEGARLHASVIARREATNYAPRNLPERFEIEP